MLQSRYDLMKVAMAAHDEVAVAMLLAPNFVSEDVSANLQTASQMIKDVNNLKADPNKSSKTTLVSVESVTRKRVMVVQRYDIKTVRADPDGSRHTFDLMLFQRIRGSGLPMFG